MSEEQEAALTDDQNMPPLDDAAVEEESQNVESAPTEQDEAPVERDRVQERINKITADKYEEKRAKEEAQRRADELELKLKELSQTSSSDEPKLEDFDYDDTAYQAALIKHEVGKQTQAFKAQQQQEVAQQKAMELQGSFNESVAKFIAKTPDYHDVIAKIPEFKQETVDAIMLAADGPAVAYFLGNHLDVADEIASMPPIQAAIRIGQISTKLSVQRNQAQPSAAPEPVSTISSGGVVNKDISDLSMEEIYNS